MKILIFFYKYIYIENSRILSITNKKDKMAKENLYYEFSKELPNNLTVSGLSGIEWFGRWSDSSDVIFNFSKLPNEDLILKFDTMAFIVDNRDYQNIEVFVNEKHIETWNFKYGQRDPDTTIKVYKEMIKNDGDLNIKFKIENPVSPKEVGFNEDIRKIAISFKKLIIEKLVRHYEFSTKELPSNLIVLGLWEAENWGRWSVDSVIEFEFYELPIKDLIFKFDTFAFINELKQKQAVNTFINHKYYKTWNYEFKQPQPNITFEVSQQEMMNENDGHLIIRFEIEDPIISPCELGLNRDWRKLAVAFKNLSIYENNNPFAKLGRKV